MPNDHVRVLCVFFSSDLRLDKHVTTVNAACFYWPRQLRRRATDADSTKKLVHAFISSRVDYCNAVFNGAPQYVMDTLQRVLNAAAHLVTDTRKYNRGLSTLIHDQLHWLNVPDRVEYSWLSWSVGVWRTKHQGIWSTAALRSPTLPVNNDDQPTCTA